MMTRTESSPFKGATDGTHIEDPITIKSTSTKIPQGLEAEVLKYLKFEDLKHGNVLEGNLLFREESIHEFMEEINFDEPIRHIFKDFDNAAGVVDDDGRLQLEYLKALMKNKNLGNIWKTASQC